MQSSRGKQEPSVMASEALSIISTLELFGAAITFTIKIGRVGRIFGHQAAGDPTAGWGPNRDRNLIATLNRPLLRGRGAAADALDGFARQLGHGVRNHVPP